MMHQELRTPHYVASWYFTTGYNATQEESTEAIEQGFYYIYDKNFVTRRLAAHPNLTASWNWGIKRFGGDVPDGIKAIPGVTIVASAVHGTEGSGSGDLPVEDIINQAKTYADSVGTNSVSSANQYTDQREIAIKQFVTDGFEPKAG